MNLFAEDPHLQTNIIDDFSCETCGRNNIATETGRYTGNPRVLLVQLERGRTYPVEQRKICEAVEFPFEGLQLEFHSNEDQRRACLTYDLLALIVHHGSSLNSGHYTAYARRQ